jgi:predicted dehydrogenase
VSDTPLKVAFAGANAQRAWAKDAHLPAVRALTGLALYAVSARDQQSAGEAAAAFGAARAYGDSLEMVRDPAIDIVSVTVKVPEHRAIVLAALEAGKHLYCEWPLGRDLSEAEEMAAAAKAAGVHVAIGLQGENSNAVRHAAQLVRDGAIGRLLSLRVISPTAGWGAESPPFYAYLQDKRNGATLSTIAGGHTLAAIEAVAGDYRDVTALNSILVEQMRLTGTDGTVTRTSPDHIVVIGRHEGGCISSLEVLGGVADPVFLFELRGEKGNIKIEGHFAGGYQGSNLTVSASVPIPPMPEGAAPELIGPAQNVSQLYARLESDIRSDTWTTPDFDRAVRLTRLLDAIDLSSDEGRRVTVGR